MKPAAVLMCALLAACASAPPMPPAEPLFNDALFGTPAAPVNPASAMALSDAMRQHIARLTHAPRGSDRKRLLIDALYRKGDLQLEYDAAVTRTAAEAFDARAGNCLALVMMTGAFAKELGLTVHYQLSLGDEVWDRADGLYLSIGHVNLTLSDRAPALGYRVDSEMTVDFLPQRDGAAPRVKVIDENTVIAMFANNRAVESLSRHQLDDAYAWAREAIRADPELLAAYVTLAAVYRDSRYPQWADAVLQRVLARTPDDPKALGNRVLVLRDLGRDAEADALKARLDRLDPHPPYSYFNQGMAALRAGQTEAARRLFQKEAARAPYNHEFQFWLAVTDLSLNDPAAAASHLTRAIETSTTRKDHDLYTAKLDRLKALQAH